MIIRGTTRFQLDFTIQASVSAIPSDTLLLCFVSNPAESTQKLISFWSAAPG